MSERFSAFRHSSYRRYFGARFCTAFAAQILSVSVAWQMYDETRKRGAPWLDRPRSVPAGITARRCHRPGRGQAGPPSRDGARHIYWRVVCAAVILYHDHQRSASRRHSGAVTTLTLFGIARAFMAPASSSLAVNLVPKEDFASAAGFSAMSWQTALYRSGRWLAGCCMA